MASNHVSQREESSEDFNEAGLSAQSSSNTDCSSSDRSDDISISKFKPEEKDTIEKAKKALLARVRTQVSTSLMLPVYPYPKCEPGQSQDGVQRPK